MKFAHGWHWPDGEQHMLEWITDARNKMMLHGRLAYQGPKIKHALDLAAKHRRLRLAVDIGAHIGLWAYNLAHYFDRVECFEPVAEHRACFVENTKELLPRPVLHACALGDEEKMVNIWSNPTSSGDSWVKGEGDIPMKLLDSFGFKNVDLIKVDAEGYEELILRGGEHTILASTPIIVVEQKRDFATKFGLKPQGAVDYLRQFGYEVESVMAGDFFMVHRGAA